ncbi:MAG: hypothetical protein WCD89_05790 [Anaerocolumna sp.]
MKKNKNFTLYWLVILGALLTVPIAFVIIKRFTDTSDFLKALLITIIFLIITGAITIMYNRIFGVTIDEIAQSKKVTELDKKLYWLLAYTKKHNNASKSMQRLRLNIDKAITQIEIINRRKEVFLGLLDSEQREKGDALSELVNTVEDALDFNIDKVIDRINIFDDKVQVSIINRNLEYIERYVDKNETILFDFEKLIAEVSSMGDASEEIDISKLTDMIQAMESLRTEKDDEMDSLLKKYE